jgi:hypothetical protein
MKISLKVSIFFFFLNHSIAFSQSGYELDTGWKCAPVSIVKATGGEISTPSFPEPHPTGSPL